MSKRAAEDTTLLFLGKRHLEHCSLQRLAHFRKVLIVTHPEVANISAELRQHFSAIHTVDVLSRSELQVEMHPGQVEEIVAGYHQKTQLHLFCNEDFDALLAGKMRTLFNIPGSKKKQVEPLVDKLLFKQTMLKENIRVPHFLILDTQRLSSDNLQAYYHCLIRKLGPVFVLKPRNGAACQSVFIVRTYAEFTQTAAHIIDDKQDYEIEEFIQGKLYHCDTVTHNGKLHFAGCMDQGHPCVEFTQGKAIGSMPLLPNDPLSQRLLSATEKMLTALGMPDGIHHTELFVQEKTNEVVIIESQSRSPGLHVVNVYKETFGINLLDFHLSLVTGVKIPQKLRLGPFHFYVYYPYKQGVLHYNHLPKLHGTTKLKWMQPEGKSFTETSKNILEQAAVISSKCEQYEQARADFNRLIDYPIAEFINTSL